MLVCFESKIIHVHLFFCLSISGLIGLWIWSTKICNSSLYSMQIIVAVLVNYNYFGYVYSHDCFDSKPLTLSRGCKLWRHYDVTTRWRPIFFSSKVTTDISRKSQKISFLCLWPFTNYTVFKKARALCAPPPPGIGLNHEIIVTDCRFSRPPTFFLTWANLSRTKQHKWHYTKQHVSSVSYVLHSVNESPCCHFVIKCQLTWEAINELIH